MTKDDPVPRRLIAAVLIEHQGSYLFIRQDKHGGAYPGTWHIPGGGLEAGEDPESAARREVREEVGLELDEVRPAGFDWDTIPYKGEDTQLIFLRFTATAATKDVIVGDDASDARWVPGTDLASMPHNAASRAFLRHLRLI